jgi:hypothetical protein
MNMTAENTKYKTTTNSVFIILPNYSTPDSRIVYRRSGNQLIIIWNKKNAPVLSIASTINTITIDKQLFNLSLNSSDYSRSDYITLYFLVTSISTIIVTTTPNPTQGYIAYYGKDQDGQTIQSYSNTSLAQCRSNCDIDPICNGIVYYNGTSDCWTIKDNPSMYDKTTSNVYMKPKKLKYKDWDANTCSAGDVVTTDYWKCANKNLEKCCKGNTTWSGYCAYDVKPCDNGLSGRDPVYTNIVSPANNLTDVNNKYSYNIPGYGYYYE